MSEYLEWQRGLVAKYPALLDRAGADPRCVILIGDGWRRIVETMLPRMDGILDETIGTWVTIDGIETKNGTMHVRSTGLVMDEAVKARIEEVSDLAELNPLMSANSAVAPGVCSKPRQNGWSRPAGDMRATVRLRSPPANATTSS
jgi:hypothetical protein